MTFYFIGGEDHDFTKVGACTVDTATTAARRTANARCSLKVGVSAALTDGWVGTLSQAVSSLWFTTRFDPIGSVFGGAELFALTDGATRRLLLRITSSKYELCKRTSTGTTTVLATSSVLVTGSVLQKLDVNVVYGTSGSVTVYLDGTAIITYSGDVTTDGATTLSGFILGTIGNGSATSTHWSEIICANEDTRALYVATEPITGNGNTVNTDSGNYASVNEVVVDDTNLITSGTAGQLAQFTVNSSAITGTPAIRAVCISARAQKGGSGPQNVKMNVRVGGIDQFGSTVSLPAAMNRVSYVFPTNPGTGGPWAYSDLTAAGFNIGIRSET